MGCCPLLKGTETGPHIGYTEETAVSVSCLLHMRIPSNISRVDLFLLCPPHVCTQSSSVWTFKGLLSCSAPSCVITEPDLVDKASLAGTTAQF